MTEPEHAGSNPVWLSATAAKDGEDYVIDGHKWFTTAAVCAGMAQRAIASGRIEES